MDNLGAASIVAVDTAAGKTGWRYSAVPGDPWDYDVPQTPMVITLDGKKTVVQPYKTGFIHYLDAKTGPVTYMHGGKQYIVHALGGTPGFGRDEAWNAEFGSMVVGFTR
jgi:glucose dehydrogenase